MPPLKAKSRLHHKKLLGVSLIIIGVSLLILIALALSQLRTVADVYEARELRALGQYARVAAREYAYRLTEAEGGVLSRLQVDTKDTLITSFSAIESNALDVGCFALFEDGQLLYPTRETDERDIPLDALLARSDYLSASLTPSGSTRISFDGAEYYPAASCYRLVHREREGVVGFCWSRERVITWCRNVALEIVPAGYVLEIRDLNGEVLHRYPPETPPLLDGIALVAAEPMPPDTLPWIAVVWPEDPETVNRIVREQVVYYSAGIGLLVLMLAVGVGILAVGMWRAAELARLKADFAANVSHELRTPLALIRAAGESLGSRRDLSPERRERYLGIIDRETRRLNDLISNVMLFTRQESGAGYDLKERDVCRFVRGFVEDYGLHARAMGFDVVTRIPETPLLVRIDEDAMLAALVNLLDNAIKFSPDKKPIEIAVTAATGAVEIRVVDQGVGIAREHHERVFEEFHRVESNLVKKTRGTGIGLALVREIVMAHGGEVWVDSTPGQGATFAVRLPMNQKTSDGVS